MKFGIASTLGALQCLAGIANALIITANTFDSTQNRNINDGLTVNAGVYYAIVNGATTTITGNVNIIGSWYVTSTTGASSVSQSGGQFTNSGLVTFNSIDGLASSYSLKPTTFTNNGQFYMGVGIGAVLL